MSSINPVHTSAPLLPVELGGKFCAFLDVHIYMSIIPRVCKTWYTYLGQFIVDGHLNLTGISWRNPTEFLHCFKLMKRRTNYDNLKVLSLSSRLHDIRNFKLVNYFPHLTEVNVKNMHVKEINSLIDLPLRILRFDNGPLSDSVFKIVEKMPLITLKLSSNTMIRLPQLQSSLQTLDLSNTLRLTSECFDSLAALPLQSLDVSRCSWVDDLSRLQTHTSLRSLNLSETMIRNHHLNQLPKQLTALNLTNCFWINDLSDLKSNTSLRSLNLSELSILNHNLEQLPKQLTDLNISRCFLITQVDPLMGLTELQTLNLTGTGVLNITAIQRISLTIIREQIEQQQGTDHFVDPPLIHRVNGMRRGARRRLFT